MTMKKKKKSNLSNVYSVLVVGSNPNDLISEYDLNIDTKPYILYKYSDMDKLRQNKILFYEELKKSTSINKRLVETMDLTIKALSEMSDMEHFKEIGKDYGFDGDGNIISTENPKGKWYTCEEGGKHFSESLKNKSGEWVTSELMGNIKWSDIHRNEDKMSVYNRTWDLCVNKLKIETDKDNTIYENMKDYSNYFKGFKNKTEYVEYSTSFFTNAILINNKWIDMEYSDSMDWVINFYDRYVLNIKKDELITIYECTK